MKCLVESSVELRRRHEDAGHNAQMYLAEWLEPRGQHSDQSGVSGYQGGKTRFAYFAAHDLNRQLRTKLRPDLIAAPFTGCDPLSGSVVKCCLGVSALAVQVQTNPARIGLGFSA